ncbi:CBM35 domain-containing protein [Streptomyces sp. NPDC007940]|uniref:CBM35 domain-containing protein n=1 Tax=Streptomyces sp. NPDC007940 TaxID=3364796 RepID=UPI0036E2B260
MPRTPHSPRRTRRLFAVSAVAVALVGTALTGTVAQAATPQLTVDLGQTTGAVMHGANGTLYGLSDDGVPGDNLLDPLHMTTVVQKAPDGLQHPNGDALTVKAAYDRSGGGDVYIYMQDYYAQWPYENLGLDDYLAKVDTMVRKVAARPDADDFVWVPFNEPDGNWYGGLGSSDTATYTKARDRFESDWATVHKKIRSIIPDARIAGPNETHYDTRLMNDFYPWAKANDVLPDITTWHELDPGSLSSFETTLAAYRTLEKNTGIPELPVSINEFANRRDQSVPGQMVQWLSMFERNKVYADQAYWNIAGNLNDNAVQTNIPNGTWWLLRWYAGLTGRTVQVSPPQANTTDTLQGIGSLDTGRKQAQVLLGGSSGAVDTVLRHMPSSFGPKVNVTVERVGWSGYEGAAAAPSVVSRTSRTVGKDRAVTVPLTGLDPMAAYRVTVNPAGKGAPASASLPWSVSYEAENAAITAGTVYSQGSRSNPYGFATSGTRDVGSLNQPTSKVAFTVDVPKTGTYDLDVFYGNQSGTPSTQTLTVDGGSPVTLTYGSTLNWTYRSVVRAPLTLTAGTHTLTLAKGTSEVTLDKIDLTASATPQAVYPATYADITGSPSYEYRTSGTSGAGALVLDKGDKAVFDVDAPADGYYTVRADYSATGRGTLSLDGATAATLLPTQGKSAAKTLRLYLTAGINRVTAAVPGQGRLTLSDLRVTGAPSSEGVTAYEAEDGVLAGRAAVAANSWTSGGRYVGNIGNGPGNTLSLKVRAAKAGRYVMSVRYANNELAGSGNYNTNVVSRAADITVGDSTRRVMFRNSYSWSNYWYLPVPVTLEAGDNTVTFANATAYAPDIDRVTVAPLNG